MKLTRCVGARNWSGGPCRKWPGRRSASTWRTTAAPNCSTRSSTRNCPATPRRWSGSASDLPDAPRAAARRGADTGAGYTVRDYGLLEAALARPQATAFGKDAYPDLDAKAAALLHSIARNHALVDGNKRLALAPGIPVYGLNGRRPALTNDKAYDLVISVAAGQLDDADAIAAVLRNATQPRG